MRTRAGFLPPCRNWSMRSTCAPSRWTRGRGGAHPGFCRPPAIGTTAASRMSGVGRRDRARTGLRMARCRRVGQTRCGGVQYLLLLLLLPVLGVGLAVAAQPHATAVQRQCEQELLAIGWQFRTALGRYHEAQQVAGKKEYPPSLEDLLQDPRFPGIERHLRKIFVDPITRKKQWGTLKIGGRIVGVHSLSEAATLKRDGFEPEDMAFKGKQKYSDWVFTSPPNLIVPVESEAAPGASGAAPGASSGK